MNFHKFIMLHLISQDPNKSLPINALNMQLIIVLLFPKFSVNIDIASKYTCLDFYYCPN